jgi:hypothetical protein
MNANVSIETKTTSATERSPKNGVDAGTGSQSATTQQIMRRRVEDQIRDRAYELYVQRGCRGGNALQDWLEAELELLANR